VNPPSKTLIIRFSSIGDIVLSTPLLRVLRAKFPNSQIDYVTRSEYAELVQSNHNLNLVHAYDASEGFDGLRRLKKKLKQERYELIVDIHGSLRSGFIRSNLGARHVLTMDKRKQQRFMLVKLKKNTYDRVVPVEDRYIEPLKEFGVVNDGKGPELNIPDEILFGVSAKIAKLKLNKFEKTVGLCPSSRHFTKRWANERYTELGIRLAKELDAKILIFGGKEDVELNSRIAAEIVRQTGPERATHLSGELSLLESAAAMEFCDLIVSNDSGLMHLATAMHKKLVVVAGSTVREFGFFPSGPHTVILERNGLYCRPCSHIGRSSCPEKHFRCMNEIDVKDVFAAVDGLIKKEDSRQPHTAERGI
jgi:heptosyltransferase-2